MIERRRKEISIDHLHQHAPMISIKEELKFLIFF